MLLLYRLPGPLVVVLSAAMMVGCAQQSTPVASAAKAPPATGPATWTLEQIGPAPVLPRPATRPADDMPPLESIELFARARAESQDGRRQVAISLLQRALELDPESGELNYELGMLYRQGLGFSADALKYFERAAQLRPDRLDLQLDIARQHLAANDVVAALDRLRLAVQTTDYADGNLRSAEADFLLAHALNELGYQRAALDRFELLIGRLARGDVDRSDEVAGILSTRLYMQVGDLYLRQNRVADALAAYRIAEGTLEGVRDIEVQSRIVRAMMLSGQVQAGVARAADVVRQFGASPASLSLLRDVYAATGRPDGVTAALSDLHRQSPDDRAILFALCEVLAADGRFEDAEARLTAAWQRMPGSALLVRWFRLRFDRDPAAAVHLLTELLTDHPALAGQIDPVWRRILSPEGRRRLTIDQLASMPPSNAGVAAAHHFVVWRVARDWPRSSLARRSLASALGSTTPFPPAFIARMEQVLSDERLSRRSRLAEAIELANAAEMGGAPGLADLLRGSIALFQGEPAEARSSFAAAAGRHPDWPEVRLGVARALIADGEEIAAVNLAWEVARDCPGYEASFLLLNDYPHRAEPTRLFSLWRDAQAAGEPASPALAIEQAKDQLVRGRSEGSELLLTELEHDFPADAGLLEIARQIVIAQPGLSPEARNAAADAVMTNRLEQLLGREQSIGPAGLAEVAIRLARLYDAAGRHDEAVRVLGFARSAIGHREPDLLFAIAETHMAIGETATAERLMTSVLEIDPHHAGAAFELSSLWTDQGRQLAAAERLARDLADRFPSDPRYRGNVGWTLYRAGNLQAAKGELLSAVSLSEDLDGVPPPIGDPTGRGAKPDRADPVLLDRAGDALYRLGDRQTAAAFWERAQRRLGDADVATAARPDIEALRQTLPRKLRQHRTGQDVQVSAVVRGLGE